MSKKRCFYSILLGYIAIALGFVLFLTILVIEYTPSVKASQLLLSNCDGNKSFFLPEELYGEEKVAFSDNAKAFSFLSSSGSWLRIVTDLSYKDKTVFYSVTLKTADRRKVDFSDIEVVLNFDDGVTQELVSDIGLTNSITVKGERSADQNDFSAELLISSKNGHCYGKIPNALVYTDNSGQSDNLNVVKGNQLGEYLFPKGYTPIGFASWRDLKAFTDKGLTILKYDHSNRNWVLNPQNDIYFAEPGLGYLVYNPNKNAVRVRSDTPFYVSPIVTSHTLKKGWNFMFNDTGNDSFAKNIKFNVSQNEEGISLLELVESSKAYSKIFFVKNKYAENSHDFEVVDLKALDFKKIIPDGSFFWVYLFEDLEEKDANCSFDVDLRGGGDSYSKGQFVQFEVIIANNNPFDVLLSDNSQKDPCLVGLEFFDQSGNKIESDFDNRECPLWPKTLLVKQGDDIIYNFSWKASTQAEGEIKVRAYFDYTRMGKQEDMLYNEEKIFLR